MKDEINKTYNQIEEKILNHEIYQARICIYSYHHDSHYCDVGKQAT